MLDDIVDALEDFWYVAAGIIPFVITLLVLFGGVHIGLPHNNSYEVISVDVISDEGVASYFGSGNYYAGSTVELSITVYVGWFFLGWYDSDGNLLSEDYDYTFKPSGSCKIHAMTERGYGINLYKTAGIQAIMGRGTYNLDENAVVSAKPAAGQTFDGWYDASGNKISSSETLTVTDHKDHVLIARAAASNPYLGDGAINIGERTKFTEDGTYMVLLNERTRDVVASSSGNQKWSVDLAPGLYELIVKGVKTNGYYGSESKTILVDGVSSNIYQWTFNNTEYTLTWDLDTSVYKNYTKITANRAPQSTNTKTAFVDYDSAEVQKIASKLLSLSAGMDALTRANFVLKFVQLCTVYEHDYDYNGKVEYWKYPVETLFEGKGDCEDTSILYCALMKAMGYDVAILLYYDHAAASVALNTCPGGTYYLKDGYRFYYCESTSDTMNVGEFWDKYDRGDVLIIW